MSERGSISAVRRYVVAGSEIETKRILLIGIYAFLGLAAACSLSACFPSAEGKQPDQERKSRNPRT